MGGDWPDWFQIKDKSLAYYRSETSQLRVTSWKAWTPGRKPGSISRDLAVLNCEQYMKVEKWTFALWKSQFPISSTRGKWFGSFRRNNCLRDWQKVKDLFKNLALSSVCWQAFLDSSRSPQPGITANIFQHEGLTRIDQNEWTKMCRGLSQTKSSLRLIFSYFPLAFFRLKMTTVDIAHGTWICINVPHHLENFPM